MSNKYLILKGCAGLGNRLFTLANAIDYAKRNSRILLVDWSDGQFAEEGKNAFFEYFTLNNVEHIHSLEEIHDLERLSVYPALWKKHPRKGLYDLYIQEHSMNLKRIPRALVPKGKFRKIYGFWEPISKRQKALHTDAHALRSIFDEENIPMGEHFADGMKENILFFSDFMPAYDAKILRNNIRLTTEMQKQVELLRQQLFNEYRIIGVHIRSTDKKPTASLHKLIDRLTTQVEGKTRIFLATDNKNVEGEFRKRFTDLITLPKFLPEEQKEGLHQWALYNKQASSAQRIFKESILDMWLLSLCNELYYQGNSSFSRVSKELKNDGACFDWQMLAA